MTTITVSCGDTVVGRQVNSGAQQRAAYGGRSATTVFPIGAARFARLAAFPQGGRVRAALQSRFSATF
jgi:hypothetical protein